MPETICLGCQNILIPRNKAQKFCSKRCAGRYYRTTNREKYNTVAREYMRKARKKYPERIRAINAKYRQKPENRIWAKEKSRKWHAENTDYANQRRIVRKQMQRVNQPWMIAVRGAQQRAKKKNIPFDLTYEWAQARWTGRCELTNIPFALGIRHSRHVLNPSIDKIDATKGYVRNNCRFILHCLNTFKYTGTDENMYRVARALLANKAMIMPRAEETKAMLSLPA